MLGSLLFVRGLFVLLFGLEAHQIQVEFRGIHQLWALVTHLPEILIRPFSLSCIDTLAID